MIQTDSDGNTAIHYGVREPGLSGEELLGGDSGGPCFRTTGTTSATLFGIHKAGAIRTSSRGMAAVSFSAWLRTFVPRT